MIFTVFPRVTNDNRRLWSQPKVVNSLNFDLIRSESVCIIDVVFQPFGGCILPLLSGISPSPPHQVLQVGPIPLSVGQRLKARIVVEIKINLKVRINKEVEQFLMGLVPFTSQLISMLFLHVPTPFTFFGMTSGAVQENKSEVNHKL